MTPSAAQTAVAGPGDGQMLLEADTLVYDQDKGTVSAAGNVRIDYNGSKLVADRVVYDQKSGRLLARGRVEIQDRGGNRTFGDEIDITEDFRNGFVNALQIETADKVYFGAESAERRDGNITTLNTGVYTACAPCEEKPDRPPIWRIKAARIIWNGKEKVVRFEKFRFELFGLPIAYLPAFEIPDPTVKRKTGFLFPSIRFGTAAVGFGVNVPYYWALSPTYDLTANFSALSAQGLLTDLEWRQRFNSGEYSVRAAGIYQLQPNLFSAGTHGAANRFRGMIGTTGRFQINPRWAFGWRYLLQSDEDFAYNYTIPNYSSYNYIQEAYLTGLNDRNFFDLRAQQFKIQEATTGAGLSEILPAALPLLDYSYTIDRPVAGGELAFDVNVQHVRRDALYTSPTALATGTKVLGIAGNSSRFTAEAVWRKRMIAPGGLVITPLLHARGDAILSNPTAATQATIAGSTIDGAAVPSDLRSNYQRGMVTAGLEASWPFLFTTRRTTHIIEPVAQVFARPDAPFGSVLGIPNEDAQSMVFDAGNLFERDKFSGYDLMEGGVRANVGFRYTGTFGKNWVVSAIAGQSYHLAGTNTFATPNLVYAGAFSGLETPRSDYVAATTIRAPRGTELLVGGRFDETTLAMRRLDVRASGTIGTVSASLGYAFIQAQPLYGFAIDRHQVSASASAKVHDYWKAFGAAAYDLQAMNLISTSIGFGYDDECFGFTFSAAQSYGAGNSVTGRSFGVQISFRTIGDFGQSSNGIGLSGL
ncbi:MAG: LPS-assembly protein LptD [Rhizobiaceae bacterium]|nr:LPS-assembly protein LptD [Rhizobiaceae bacterium]